MAHRTHSYLFGAVSGTALIAAAVVAFVLLVSIQAFRDWPLPGLLGLGGGEGGSAASVAAGRPAAGGGTGAAVVAGATGARGVSGSPDRQSGVGQLDGAAGEPGAGSPTATSPAAGGPGSGSTPVTRSSPLGSSGFGGGGSGPGLSTSGGSSPSGMVTGAVDDTVSGADRATGGALGGAGVTEVTESVNGAAGPESVVGRTVDGAAEAVGDLLDRGG